MPELPEAESIARALNLALRKRKIASVAFALAVWAGVASGETADRAVLSGLGEGPHYLRFRREAVTYWPDGSTYLREPYHSPFYVNGRLVGIDRATSPKRADDGREYQWVETGPLALADGDSVAILGTEDRCCGAVLEWEVATNRLTDAWYRCCDPRSGASTVRAVDFTDVSFTAGRFAVTLANRLARTCSAHVTVLVQDYWQRELAFVSEDVSFDSARAYDLPFADGSADSYRARVIVTLPDGLEQERTYVLDAPSTAGPHRLVDLNAGWSFTSTTDDCTRASREMRESPPDGSVWSAVDLPHEKLHISRTSSTGPEVFQKWYRKTFAVPAASRGERYVFRLERPAPMTRVYVNGAFCGSNDLAQTGQPLAVDVTSALVPDGENTIFLAMQGRSAFLRDADLDTLRSPGPDDAWYGEWSCEAGIVAEAFLESMPSVAILSAPRIVTSLSNRTVTVVTPLAPDGYAYAHRVKYRGEEVLGAFSGTAAWTDPLLWGPTAVVTRAGRPAEFPLYELETRLVANGSGAVVDRLSTRFGFREFATRGRDFLWNGKSVKGVGRAMAPTYGRLYGAETRQALADHARALRAEGTLATVHGRHTQAMLDYLDENGVLAYQASYFDCNGTWTSPKYTANPAYWEQKRAYDLAAVDIFGNHPALYTWILSNEFHLADPSANEESMRAVIRAVSAKDPTRFCECSCDLDMHGETPCISLHYPVWNAISRAGNLLPDAFWWRPLDTPFTVGCRVPFGVEKQTCNVATASPVTWGSKPIAVHETGWDYFMRYPHAPTRIWGEEAYSSTRMGEKMHLRYNNLYIEGHRDADCCMAVPWRAIGSDDTATVCPPVEVILCRKYRAFYAGTSVAIEADIAHDARAEEDLDWYWEIAPAGGGASVLSGGETLHADWGCLFRRTICFTAPAEGRYVFRYGVRGKIAHETTMRTFAPIAETKYANVIGPDDPLEESVLAEVAGGGTLVLLARSDYPSWLPYVPVPSDCNGSINFTFRPDHPVLDGLDADDFSFWYPTHRTGAGYFPKPTSGAIRTILECGGPDGLVYSGLIEVPYARGSIFYSRLDLDATARAQNPVAAKLLANLAAYRADRPAAPGVLGYWPAGNALSNAFARLGVTCRAATPPYAQYAAIWADGSAAGAAAFLESVTSVCSSAVFVTDPTADFGLANSGTTPYLYPSRAVKTRADEPILRGLTNGDFLNRHWESGQYAENSMAGLYKPDHATGPVGRGELLSSDGEDLLYPRYLVRKGNVYFTTLAFEAAVSNTISGLDAPTSGDASRAARILTTLVANAGVTVTNAVAETGVTPGAAFLTQTEIEALKSRYAGYGACMRGENDFVQALDWYGKCLALDYNQPSVQTVVAELTALVEAGQDEPADSVPQTYTPSGRCAGSTPGGAMDWSDARNWLFGGRTASAPPSGARALACFDPAAATRYVRIPETGATVGGVCAPLDKNKTVFIGGPLEVRADGWTVAKPVKSGQIVAYTQGGYASYGLWSYGPLTWPNGWTAGHFTLCSDAHYDRITLASGVVWWRGDLYANGPSALRDGDLAVGFVNLSSANFSLTGPTGSDAKTCTWSQTAGSPFVTRTSAAAAFPAPGAAVSGAGLPAGTHLLRIFPDGLNAELSAPATETRPANAVAAAAFAPRSVAYLGTLRKNDSSAPDRTFLATKRRAEDDFTIVVSNLQDSATDPAYVLRLDTQTHPAHLVLRKADAFRSGIAFQNADVEFANPDASPAGLPSVTFARVTESGAAFTCAAGVDAVVTNVTEVSAPLVKRGAGTLRLLMKDGCVFANDALSVEGGTLVLSASAPTVVSPRTLTLAAGATLVLAGGVTLDVTRIAGEGKVVRDPGAPTVTGTWNDAVGAGTSVTEPAVWMAATNWVDGALPFASGDRATFASGTGGTREIRVPEFGVTLTALALNGRSLVFSGGPLVLPNGMTDAAGATFFCDVTLDAQGTGLAGQTFAGRVALPQIGGLWDHTRSWTCGWYGNAPRFRLDWGATSADWSETIVNATPTNGMQSGSHGGFRMYAPRGTDAALTAACALTAGSAFVRYLPGNARSVLPVGTRVTGPGLAADTFLRAIRSDDWLELSACAETATGVTNDLVFAAYSPRVYQTRQYLDCWNGGPQTLYMGKYRQKDVFRYRIGHLRSQSALSDDALSLRIDVPEPGMFPATLILGNTGEFESIFYFTNGHLEFDPQGSHGFTRKARVQVSGSARLTAVEGLAIGIPCLTNWVGTLVKDGPGTLGCGVRSPANGTLAVDEGTFVWTNATPGGVAQTLARLTLGTNAVLSLPEGVLTVGSWSGAGAVTGDIALKAGATWTVAVAADGSVAPLAVEGSADLSGGGTIVLTGSPAALKAGTRPLLLCGDIAPGEWTVSGADGALRVDADGLYLDTKWVSPDGMPGATADERCGQALFAQGFSREVSSRLADEGLYGKFTSWADGHDLAPDTLTNKSGVILASAYDAEGVPDPTNVVLAVTNLVVGDIGVGPVTNRTMAFALSVTAEIFNPAFLDADLLKAALGVTGAAVPDPSVFSPDTLDCTFGTPTGGLLPVLVTPKPVGDAPPAAFFLRTLAY